MKKILFALCAILCLVLSACNHDDPEADGKGYLNVTLFVSEFSNSDEEIDYSKYDIAITRMNGWGYTAKYGDVEWPIELEAGDYIVSAGSPLLSETLTTETYYFGKKENVKITKNQTKEITIVLKRETIEK